MAKNSLLMLALAAFVAGGVFAIEVPEFRLSFGGGLEFDGGALGRNETGPNRATRHGIETYGFGAWLFADATFAELSVAFRGGPAVTWSEWPVTTGGGWGVAQTTIHGERESGSFTALDISLVGKFPFSLGGGNISLFPLLGFGYNVVLSAGDDNGSFYDQTGYSPASKLSAFRIHWGIGGDFDLSGNLFLRASILGNYRFAPDFFTDLAETHFYHGGIGGTVRIGIGIRL